MLTVREATKDDADVIYNLILAIAEYHNQAHSVITTKNELLNSGFGSEPKFGVLLAELNGKAAGYVSYTWNYSIWLGSSYMNIDDVFVREEFRGQRVGEALMLKAKEICRKNGLNRIRWEVQKNNHLAIKFYERLGANLDIKGIFHWDVAE